MIITIFGKCDHYDQWSVGITTTHYIQQAHHSLAEIAVLQREDAVFKKVFMFMEKTLLEDDENFKRIAILSASMTKINNVLYFISKNRKGDILQRLAIPEVLRTDILTEIHEQTGHQGVVRT